MNDQKSEKNALRPEYDFSPGIRGKHAARFSVSPGEPAPVWLRDAIRYDRQAWISEALRRSQELEGLLVVYLALAFHLEPGDAGRDVSHFLEDPEEEALKRISADLEADGRALGDLRSGLDRLVNERLWLVHRSLHQPEAEANPRAAGRLTARLQQLSAETAAMTERLRQLILAKFMRAGMTQTEFEERAESVLQQWLAA
jgi:hypothetical protein